MHINRHGLQFKRSECWDNSTLNKIIVIWLKKFKEECERCSVQGVPNYDEFRNNDGDLDFDKWMSAIQFIIESLDADKPEYKGDFIAGKNDGKVSESESTCWDFKPDSETKWEEYKAATKTYYYNRKKALELFTKYYEDLWN